MPAEVDSFFAAGDTGNDSFDALYPNEDLFPDTDLYSAGDF